MSQVLSITKGSFGQAYLINKSRRSGAHAHRDAHLMLQIEGATHKYLVGSEIAELNENTAVLVNQHVLHENFSVGEGESIVLMFYLSPEWIIKQRSNPFMLGQLFTSTSVQITPEQQKSKNLLAKKMLFSELIHQSKIADLCESLALSFIEKRDNKMSYPFSMHRLNDRRIRGAITLIHENIEEPFSAPELAFRVGLSRSRFFDLFRECTGLSPANYCRMIRLEHARARLSVGQESIAEISRQCGFGAQSHFSNFFSEKLGITPSELRRAGMSLSFDA